MTTPLQALTAQPWAIEASWLHVLAAIATRNHNHPALQEREGWEKRDYEAVLRQINAGPTGRRMEGARYAMITDAGVAIIPVYGPIFPRANMMTEFSGGCSAQMVHADFQIALNNGEVDSILMVFDTPGGAVSGLNPLADAIFAGRSKKRTVAFVSGTCASGGMWLASQCNEIAIERTAVLGSIGVVAAMKKQVSPDQNGELVIEIVSSNAPNKRPDPESESGQAEIRKTLDGIEAEFFADVARGRRIKADAVKEKYGAGGVLVGQAAVSAGLADRIDSFEATYNALAEAAMRRRRMKALKQ